MIWEWLYFDTDKIFYLEKQHFRSLLGVRKCCFSLMGFFVNFFSNKIEADDLQDNC